MDDWNSQTEYRKGDKVVHRGVVYRALLPIPAGLRIGPSDNDPLWAKEETLFPGYDKFLATRAKGYITRDFQIESKRMRDEGSNTKRRA